MRNPWPEPKTIKDRKNWPPNYTEVFGWRQHQLMLIRKDPGMLEGAKAFYAENYVSFINHWVDTYDPRNAKKDTPTNMPFIMFAKQEEQIRFYQALLDAEENGLIEKSRDMGASWLSAAFSDCMWLFSEGSSIGWGSRKEALVDKNGDMDSLFEKMRSILRRLPPEFLPKGFNWNTHSSHMKLINPENGASITGEAGDNIGRGGRKTIYFKDESAHYERPELIEAALGDNTNVQIDISSVNGLGNIFHRRRENGTEWGGGDAHEGVTNVLVVDWSDHPAKDQKWYDARRKKAEADGLLHKFAQEVDRDYAASVEGVLIPSAWITAAVDAHEKLGWPDPTGPHFGGLDIADEGGDKNALGVRQDYLAKYSRAWPQGDTGETTRSAISTCEGLDIEINYDSIGYGSGVKAESNRLIAAKKMPTGIKFIPWGASDKVLNPKKHLFFNEDGSQDKHSPKNEDYFMNLKIQAGWNLRIRFEKTFKWITFGEEADPSECISLSSDIPDLQELKKELAQPVVTKSIATGKMMIDKKPDGTKSPDRYDSMAMAYTPKPSSTPVGLALKKRHR